MIGRPGKGTWRGTPVQATAIFGQATPTLTVSQCPCASCAFPYISQYARPRNLHVNCWGIETLRMVRMPPASGLEDLFQVRPGTLPSNHPSGPYAVQMGRATLAGAACAYKRTCSAARCTHPSRSMRPFRSSRSVQSMPLVSQHHIRLCGETHQHIRHRKFGWLTLQARLIHASGLGGHAGDEKAPASGTDRIKVAP